MSQRTRNTRVWIPALLVMLVIGVGRADAGSLTTEYTTESAQKGNMFDVRVGPSSLRVTSIDMNLREDTIFCQVWMKHGTHVGYEQDYAAWTLVGQVPLVPTTGPGQPTPIDFQDFVLPANQNVALYITADPTGSVFYSNGPGVGTVVASNSDLTIYAGTGNDYPFDYVWNNCTWNGTIHYDVIPEPATLTLLAIGGAVFVRRRRKHV